MYDVLGFQRVIACYDQRPVDRIIARNATWLYETGSWSGNTTPMTMSSKCLQWSCELQLFIYVTSIILMFINYQ